MLKIKQTNRKFSWYLAEFQIIAANLNWNLSALRNALTVRLPKYMKVYVTDSDMPEELAAFVTVCQKRDN
jgi:hypothetical protein